MTISPLFLIISSFALGVGTYIFSNIKNKNLPFSSLRFILYKVATAYLILKIGFIGGSEIAKQSFSQIFIPSIICITLAFFWAFFVYYILKKWSRFDTTSQLSIAAHFGSVSVGTFVAAIAFLEELHIPFDPSTTLYLVLMELPAIIFMAWKMPLCSRKIFHFIKKDWSLWLLLISILGGVFFENSIPQSISIFIFTTLFLPILLYFIFEVGIKAGNSILQTKSHYQTFLAIGILFPLIGGIFGASLGQLLEWSMGNSFLLSILLASASYVLAPLCVQEILKITPQLEEDKRQEILGISMSLSIGITLPFNIIFGLHIYLFALESIQSLPFLSLLGTSLPFILLAMSFFKKHIRFLNTIQ